MENSLKPHRSEESAALARRYFREGLCCSEAMVKATLETYDPGFPVESVLPLASGFCGGMGDRSGPCGVISGGIMALGHFSGKGKSPRGAKGSRELARMFLGRMQKEADGLVCNEILEGMRFTNWNKRGCRKLTEKGARILAEILEANRLVGF